MREVPQHRETRSDELVSKSDYLLVEGLPMMDQLRRQDITAWRERFVGAVAGGPYRAESAWPKKKPLARSAS